MEFYRRCINQDVELFQDMVLFQYFLYYRMEGNIPGLKQDYSVDKETFNMILKETGLDRRRYSDGKLMSMKQLKKHITIKVFSHDISAVLKDIKSSPVKRKLYIIFDYSKKHPITKEACFIFHNSTKGKGNNK